jgi:hypothetical protein
MVDVRITVVVAFRIGGVEHHDQALELGKRPPVAPPRMLEQRAARRRRAPLILTRKPHRS